MKRLAQAIFTGYCIIGISGLLMSFLCAIVLGGAGNSSFIEDGHYYIDYRDKTEVSKSVFIFVTVAGCCSSLFFVVVAFGLSRKKDLDESAWKSIAVRLFAFIVGTCGGFFVLSQSLAVTLKALEIEPLEQRRIISYLVYVAVLVPIALATWFLPQEAFVTKASEPDTPAQDSAENK